MYLFHSFTGTPAEARRLKAPRPGHVDLACPGPDRGREVEVEQRVEDLALPVVPPIVHRSLTDVDRLYAPAKREGGFKGFLNQLTLHLSIGHAY